LRINIHKITNEGLWLDFQEKTDHWPMIAALLEDGVLEFIEPLSVHLRAIRIRDIIEAEGRLDTRIGLDCSRCLVPFVMPLSAEFELTYTQVLPETEPDDKEEIELHAEEMRMIRFEGDAIDLRDALQDQILMSLPLQPLCSPECRGLCPRCGANLNEGDCGCDRTPDDSPFAVLKKLKSE
jgi:uncharacterized protein